jgi:broad specificity phosphatase PhoE
LDKIKVLCSTSPRASITADSLFSKSVEITRSDKFVEFDLSIFYIPFLRCSIRTWFFISRLLWFVGVVKTDRNFKQERKRVHHCVKLLTRKAVTTDVALVAHGLLNLFIEKRLNKMGWRKIHAFSSGCFAIKVLQNDYKYS